MDYGAIEAQVDEDEVAYARVGRVRMAIVLGLLTIFTTGSHYFRHSVTGLGPALMEELGVRRTGFAALFSLEQLPGVVLPALGGLFLLYLPLSATAVVLAACLLVSATVCAVAVDAGSYWWLASGRAAFGAAEGVLATLQGALIARTFRRRRVSTAFGAMLLVSRTSSFVGFALPPFLLRRSLSTAMWFGAGVLLLPLAATILHYYITKDITHQTAGRLNATEAATAAAAALRALRRLRAPFWLLSYMWATVACSVFTFAHFAPDAFADVPGISTLAASLLSGTLFLVAGIASPLVGAFADRVGRRPAMLIGAASCSTVGLVLCAYGGTVGSRVPAVLGMGLLTTCLCIAPVLLLACVAIAVPHEALPLALGAYKTSENFGLALVHVAVGALRDSSSSYLRPILLLMVIAASAIPAMLMMGRMAPKTGRPAESSKVAVDQVAAELES